MKKLRKYAVVARVSLKNAVAYRATLLTRFVFYSLFIYVFVMLWRAIYQEGSVHGYTYAQLIWYLIFTEYVGFCCGTGIFTTMNEDVKSGAIAYLIGRPTHYVFYQFANSLGQILLNICACGALAALLGLIFAGPLPGFHPAVLPPLLLSLALSIVINFFFLMAVGLSSFVMEDNGALFFIYQKLSFMLGMFLPVEFLPAWLQPVAKSLPFSYVYWAPSKLLVSYSPALFWSLMPRQLMWAAVSVALVLVCYRGGVRRLQMNGG